MRSYDPPEIKIYRCAYEADCSYWTFSNVSAPYWRFYWFANAGGEISYAKKTIALGPESFTLIPPNTCFSTRAHTAFAQFYVHFSAAFPFDRVRQDIYTFPISEHFHGRIAALEKTLSAQNEDMHFRLMLFSLIYEGLLEIPRSAFIAADVEYDPRIVKIIELLDKNTSWVFSNEELAAKVNMSVNGFIRLFSAETGTPPLQYSRRKRVEKACLLLHFTRKSIDEIARKTGFNDRYYFSRVFRQVTGYSPAAFKKIEKAMD